jgi:hypothetical protein
MTKANAARILAAAMLGAATHAGAGASGAQLCEAAKDGALASFAQCRLKADASFAKTGDAAKRTSTYARCADKLDKAYAGADGKYGGACKTSGDVAQAQSFAETMTARLRDWDAGVPGASLGVARLPDSGQTACWAGGAWDFEPPPTACGGTGQDGEFVAPAAPMSFVDNGDGTVTDQNTGLQWEKKSDDGSTHDKDDSYPWVGLCTGDGHTWCTRDADCPAGGPGGTCGGTTALEWVDGLNAAAFAGHADWRLPSIRELATLANYQFMYPSPSVSPEFNTNCGLDSRGNPGCTVLECSCTDNGSDVYWASTTLANASEYAWTMFFGYGYQAYDDKTRSHLVRAVRGGY